MEESPKPKRKNQIIAAIGTTTGAFALGSVIGWPSPALNLLKSKLNLEDVVQLSLVTSISLIGSAVAQIFTFFTIDTFGPKNTMLLTALPFIAGWLMILFAQSIFLTCAGRFITGLSGGVFCVAAPTYIGEIADKAIRGRLAVLYQLMVSAGMLFTFILGEFQDFNCLTIPLMFIPIGYFVIIIFLPESPVHLLSKSKVEKAKQSLQFYRGIGFDITEELKSLEKYIKKPNEKFWTEILTKPSLKAFGSLTILHIIQQFSGIKTIAFYAHMIFEMVGSKISSGISAIILSVIALIFTGISNIAVDILGRRILMLASLLIQIVSLTMIGVYFSMQKNDSEKADTISSFPLIFSCAYLAGFSLGSGPLPWVLLGELLPKSTKGHCAPAITMINYISAFVITETFPRFLVWFGIDMVFYFYAVVCAAGAFFVLLFLVETKGKTLDEIQVALGANPPEC